MKTARAVLASAVAVSVLMLVGCAAPTIDFAAVQRPDRAAELDAYDVFVGKWSWEAEVVNAEGPDKQWTGSAEWHWTLDNRCLHGVVKAKSANASFDAAGVWSWHPKKNQYIWWMFNNWGYPQEGTAHYDEESQAWTMKYTSVGLDGTPSYGCYRMTVVGSDTLEWELAEWADLCHMFKKLEMKGTYKREG